MEKHEIAERLTAAVKAWESLPKSQQTRNALAYSGINDNIRRALHALEGETPKDLEARGLRVTSDDIPAEWIGNVKQLIADLRAASDSQ